MRMQVQGLEGLCEGLVLETEQVELSTVVQTKTGTGQDQSQSRKEYFPIRLAVQEK